MTEGTDRLLFCSGTEVRARGAVPSDEQAARFGYAFALWLSEKLSRPADRLTVAVGREAGEREEKLFRALKEGLTSADCDVLDCDLCASPVLEGLVFGERPVADGAVGVIGPGRDDTICGFRFSGTSGLPSSEDVEQVLDLADRNQPPERLVKPWDANRRYAKGWSAFVKELLEDDALRPLLGMHAVVDASGGTGAFFAELLEQSGVDVSGSYGLTPDGSAYRDVADREAVGRLIRTVKEQEADLGIRLDRSAECVVVTDAEGRVYSGNRMIALIGAILLEKEPGITIVTDSVTSSGLSRFISEWGGVHYRFRRGSRNVIEEARRLEREGIDVALAIETSGHSAFRENRFLDDGIWLATRILCAAYELKREGGTLWDLVRDLSEPVEESEHRLRIRPESSRTGSDVIERVLAYTLEDPTWRLATDSREGVRILFDLEGGVENAWLQLRMSVHDRSVIVINAQSDLPGGTDRILSGLAEVLRDEAALDVSALRTGT